MSEYVASVESLIEMRSLVIRYRRGEDDRVNEHAASVESLIEIGSSVLRYQKGGRRSSE